MKNLKSVLPLFFILAAFNVTTAQDAYASLDNGSFNNIALENTSIESASHSTTASSLEYAKIDKTAINELLEMIKEKVDFPYTALDYSNSISLKVQVSINEFGELVAYHITDQNSLLSPTSKSIIAALSEIDRVTPILVNGKPQAITVQLPLTFKR